MIAVLVMLSSQLQSADRAQMTAGVTEIAAPGATPGTLVVNGDAFVVITGQEGKRRAPLIAATRIGDGRAVAAGHEAFFQGEPVERPDNSRLLSNILGWLAGKAPDHLAIGLVGSHGMKAHLEAMGDTVTELRPADLDDAITGYDVLCLAAGALDKDVSAQNQVSSFVKAGHGVLIAGPAWGWQQLNPTKSLLNDHTGNRLLGEFGIDFVEGTVGGPFTAQGADDPLLNTSAAVEALRRSANLSTKDAETATRTIERALTLNDERSSESILERLKSAIGGNIFPTLAKPITLANPAPRIEARIYSNQLPIMGASQIRPYPGSIDFPGPVPTSAERVRRTITVDTSVPRWHSTGLYAAPGEAVAIGLPVDAISAKLQVRIGSQTDTLWNVDKWTRFPDISQAWGLDRRVTPVASPFGGAIFIDVPAKCELGTIQIDIGHAVPAPHFVRGKMTNAEWNATEKNNPAPWAELEGKRVILSVPSSAVRGLQDPEALMAYWDEMMDLIYAFYAAPARPRPERYCVDRQISAGYMHSGYPIMTFEDVAKTFCNVTQLRAKDAPTWGFYHEMGHNFQRPDWTFDGTGEVTNNLFSLYASEHFNGQTPSTYTGSMIPAKQRERLTKYLVSGAKFSDWQNDPFLALTMFAELREAFGWEPFTKFFAEDWTLPADEKPKTDLDKHDLWMTKFSHLVGKNLGPFFTAWGIPTSQSARDSITQRGTWMPPDWPKARS